LKVKGRYSCGIKATKVKFSSLGYIAKTMNTKLNSKYRKYFHDWQLRIDVLYWGYSKSCRLMKIWTVGRRHVTSSKFPFKGYSANEWGVGVNRCHVGVQYLGEGVVSWTDVVGVNDVGVKDVGVKGCAMRRSPARLVARWCLVVPVAGVVVVAFNGGCAYKACRR